MKIIILIFLILINSSVWSQSGADIMNSARNRIQMETMSTRSRMVITARNGNTTEMMIDQYSKDGPNGSRAMIVFQRPANVAGTRFLTMDNASGGTDQWIFLPATGRSRRISATESGGSFMGTDFSYSDISLADRDVSLDTHNLLREEILNGNPVYVIESIPRDTSYQYSRVITWIDRNNHLMYKAEMFNRRNELIKSMEMSDFRDVQGRITPMQTSMATVSAGTSTTIYMEIVRYDDNIPEGVFTTAFLETGRP